MNDLLVRLCEPCRRWKRCKDTRYEAIDEIEALRTVVAQAIKDHRDDYDGVTSDYEQMLKELTE